MSYEWSEFAPPSAHRESSQTPGCPSGRDEAIGRACEALFARQAPDGFWCGELTADTTLESDYILLQLWIHQPDGATWDPPSSSRIAKASRSILARQLADGGFNTYRGGPAELNATIKAYCALKLGGHPPGSDALRRARRTIRKLGGLQAANSYVKINLSLFGLYPRQHAPSVPPEIVLLPGNVLYEMSSWTRSILVPLSIVQARGSNRRAPAGFTLEELLLPGVSMKLPKRNRLSVLFHHLDRVFKVGETWLAADSRCRYPRGRTLDSGTDAFYRGIGCHLPGHDVLHHGAGCAGLSQKPPRSGGCGAPLRIAAH